jgi:hypothetical protein
MQAFQEAVPVRARLPALRYQKKLIAVPQIFLKFRIIKPFFNIHFKK